MREPKLITVIGRKGCGKSHETVRILHEQARGNPAKSVKARRSLIFDVNDEFGDFYFMGNEHFKIPALGIKDVVRFTMSNIIEVRRVRPFLEDGSRMDIPQMSETLSQLLKVYNSGTFVVEDPAKYLPGNALNIDIVSAMATCRHQETDLLIHFQSMGRSGYPQLFANTNYIRMHKTSDTASRHEAKFEEKMELLQLAENIVDHYYSKMGDNRFYLYIDVEESKIRPGRTPFTEDDIRESIRKYISRYKNRILKPITDEIDLDTGASIYTPQEALKMLYTNLRKTYF